MRRHPVEIVAQPPNHHHTVTRGSPEDKRTGEAMNRVHSQLAVHV